MSLSKEETKKVAGLARLHMGEEELERLAPQLSKIIGFVEKLSKLDTGGVKPLANVVDIDLPLREDIINDGKCTDEILANAPESTQGYFVVPKIVE
ncbi:MAG: Asp-tRNA(Asn)/Glu-tRNA(Gln) amidotransferase subunit GatC [Alphaproteobacteria bacterium]